MIGRGCISTRKVTEVEATMMADVKKVKASFMARQQQMNIIIVSQNAQLLGDSRAAVG